MSLLSAGEIASYRSAFGLLLTHTCTLTTRGDGGERPDGSSVPSDATVTTGVPCRFETQERAERGPDGTTLVDVSTLALPATQAAPRGTIVSAVTDQLGGTPPGADGTFIIDGVHDDTAGLGAALVPVYRLSAAGVG